MKEFVLSSAAFFGGLAIIIGAFGAHALKKIFSEEQLKNFETGVKYQMYHAIVLLITGYQFPFISGIEKGMGYCFIIGIVLFSFSIYGLCISAAMGKKMTFLGPITPLGGLLFVIGWFLLLLVNFTQ
ncbi:DUF423 domain-containing protein [Aquimarina hainanensis]|uniref:DUF423 domain-containing protein n=1 Tax=Aquimarina hainanensis TaxID=1578017 RepID=A0ABW5NDH0_9FLAO